MPYRAREICERHENVKELQDRVSLDLAGVPDMRLDEGWPEKSGLLPVVWPGINSPSYTSTSAREKRLRSTMS